MSSDAETLFARFQRQGDLRALGRVVDLVGPELLRAAMHLARGPAEAEDLVQETLLTAMERAPSWDRERPLRPWLVGILTNRARLARQRGARELDPERLDSRPPREPGEQAAELELTEEVEAALGEVPASYRPVLVLRLKHHLSVPDIAEALQRPPGTVRSQLQRGLEQLRRRLPASYASTFALWVGRPPRGLGAVKADLLREASVATLAAPTLVGVLSMKLIAASVLIAAVAGTGYALFTEGRRADLPAPRPDTVIETSTERASLEADKSSARASVARGIAARVTEEARIVPSGAVARGDLVVQVSAERDGAPAAGYLVTVETFGQRPAFHDPLVAVTDAHGEAHFEGLDPGQAYARALRGSENGVPIVAGETARLHLRAWEGVTVHGEVVDAEGRAVPGARLWVSERWRSNRGHFVGYADAGGRFSLASLTSDHRVGASAPGWSSSLLHPVRGEAGDEHRLTLVLDRPGGTLAGSVFAADGTPVPEALVLVGADRPTRVQRLGDGGQALGPPRLRSHTDELGGFRLEDIEQGTVPVAVWAEGFAPAQLEVEVLEAAGPPLEIVLTRESRIVGRVTDAEGRPVPTTEIRLDPPGPQGEGIDYADLQGNFELRALGTGPIKVVARHRELGDAELELELGPEEVRRWDPVLTPARRFHGVVLDPGGTPLAGWTVVARPEGQTEIRHRSHPTDPRGAFSIPDVDDVAHEIWVQEPGGWQRFPRKVVTGLRPLARLELRLDDPRLTTGTVVGEVVGPDGEVPESARLTFWHEGLRLWREYSIDSQNGAIRVEGIPAGECTLTLRSRDFPWMDLGSFELLPGRELDLGRRVLPRGGHVVGQLEGGPEEALETLRFLLIDEQGMEAGTVQRTGRSFRSNALAPGRYRLELRGDRVAPLREEVVVTAGRESALRLSLEPASLRRVLVDVAGPAPRRLWCEVRDGSGERVWMNGNLRRLEDGRFVARISLPAGVYRVAAGDGRGRTVDAALVLGGVDDEEPLRLTLRDL